MDRELIDLAKNQQSLGTTLVALKIIDFIIAPFTLERFQKISHSSNLKSRMEEVKRIFDVFQYTMKNGHN